MLIILARLGRSESFWAVVKVRSPHTSPEVCYPRTPLSLSRYPGYIQTVSRPYPLCFYVLRAFLPSLPGWCRHADPGIKTPPGVVVWRDVVTVLSDLDYCTLPYLTSYYY